MPVKQVEDFLNKHKVKYTSMMHSPAFTAQEIAATAHVSGKQLAKIVVVKINGRLAIVVLRANDHIDFAKLHKITGAEVDLASEGEFKDQFAGCEVGAMPPFGNLYDMPVYASSELSKEDDIMFNAGSHSELMQMAFKDFERCVHPKLVELS